MLNVQNADVYTDFNGLAKLKTAAKKDNPDAIKAVARQFESLFLHRILKSMRQAKLADGIFDTDQSDFYRDMYDQQLALHLSGDPGTGLAEMIVRQLQPQASDTRQPLDNEAYLNRSVPVAPVPARAGRIRPEDVRRPDNGDTTLDSSHSITGKAQFVGLLRPYAQQAAAELGVDADLLLAQAALETGWGRSVLKQSEGDSSFNLFNIKADSAWRGRKVWTKTLEFHDGIGRRERAAFRAYDSYQESFKDYVALIKRNPRYEQAVKMASDPSAYIGAIQRAGYATDPDYADKVMRIYAETRQAGSGYALAQR